MAGSGIARKDAAAAVMKEQVPLCPRAYIHYMEGTGKCEDPVGDYESKWVNLASSPLASQDTSTDALTGGGWMVVGLCLLLDRHTQSEKNLRQRGRSVARVRDSDRRAISRGAKSPIETSQSLGRRDNARPVQLAMG